MQKKRYRRKITSGFPRYLFLTLIFFSLVTVLLLEYIDYKNGRDSFIFTRIVKLQKQSEKINSLNKELFNILNEFGLTYDYFQDKGNKFHFKITIPENELTRLQPVLEKIIKTNQGILKLSESQRIDDKSILLYQIVLNQKKAIAEYVSLFLQNWPA